MKITCQIGQKQYQFDSIFSWDISIPVNFQGDQVNLYHAPRAYAQTWEASGFTGSTGRGGSCNVDEVKFIPQCNGTHTESVGHIVNEDVFIHDLMKDSFVPSTLVSVKPEVGRETKDTYQPAVQADDPVISVEAIKKAIANFDTPGMRRGLIIRTLPNQPKKKIAAYKPDDKAPYFSNEAIHFINSLGVEHLVVDMPSIDRLDDDGKLSNHHLFWGVTEGMHSLAKRVPSQKTVTELAFIDDEIKDGFYLLNLQTAAFKLESTPSRPLLFRLKAVD